MKKFKFIVISLYFLAGCTSLNSTFDCALQSNSNCHSIDEINDQINQGLLPSRNFNLKSENTSLEINSVEGSYVTPNFQNRPIRSSEIVQRIWIAPYEDTVHNYHSDSFIYSIIHRPQWIALRLPSN